MALTALIGPATKLIGKFVKDKDLQQKLSHDIATIQRDLSRFGACLWYVPTQRESQRR